MLIAALTILIVLGAALYGYVANIIKVFTKTESGVVKFARLVGVFVPLVGCIAGFF